MTAHDQLGPRVVTTGVDASGNPAFLSDRRVNFAAHGPASVAALYSGPGVWVGMLSLASGGGPASAAWRQVPTQDITTVLGGTLMVELEAGEPVRLRPGDTLVQCGTRHRMWCVDEPVRAFVTHLDALPVAPVSPLEIGRGARDGTPRVRRVVTGLDERGRSCVVHDGEPAWVLEPSARVMMADTWQTGGPLTSVMQGGDAPGPWQRTPVGGGVLAGTVVQGPGDYDVPEAWHATPTVDVDVMTEGVMELWLPGPAPVVLAPGDVVVQRGVNHRWQPVGDVATRMVMVMIG